MGDTAVDGDVKHRERLAERPVLMGLLARRYFGTILAARGWEMCLLHYTVGIYDGVVLTTLGNLILKASVPWL